MPKPARPCASSPDWRKSSRETKQNVRGRASSRRDAAADDVDLVEAGARDEHVGFVGAGANQNLAARPRPQHELDVERLEPIGDLGLVIDDVDFVFRGQALSNRKADLAAADDEDAHRRLIVDAPPPQRRVSAYAIATGFADQQPSRAHGRWTRHHRSALARRELALPVLYD